MGAPKLKCNHCCFVFLQLQSNDVIEFTSIDFSGDSTLYISTNNGKVSAWDTRHNTCFMHWEADNSEIGQCYLKSKFDPIKSEFYLFYSDKKQVLQLDLYVFISLIGLGVSMRGH